MPAQRHLQPLLNVLLGPEGGRRLRTALTLTAFTAYLLFAVFQHLEVELGLIDRQASNRLTAFNLVGSLLFYLLVRSGLSERLAKDPSLVQPQMVFAMVAVAWSYAITGPARGAVMGIMILVILFGVFRLRSGQSWRLVLLGLGMLTAVMLWRVSWGEPRYEARVELIHFIFAVIVMGATASLAVQLSALRARLSRQRRELEAALDLNRELATRDSLTGLLNRRAATELLAREQSRLGRGQGPLALALLDIDHFKRINDGFGHDVGDQVLRRFAQVLGAQLRAADALARWGGEEFLLLMPCTRLADAALVMERLRMAVAAGGMEALVGGAGVTFSAGLIQCEPDEPQDAGVARADRALYRAKGAGRNRVVCDPPVKASVAFGAAELPIGSPSG